MPEYIKQIASALIVAAVVGLVAWSWAIRDRVTITEGNISSSIARIANLESGATTPMSRESRGRMDALEHQFERMSNKLDEISRAQSDLMQLIMERTSAQKRSEGPALPKQEKNG